MINKTNPLNYLICLICLMLMTDCHKKTSQIELKNSKLDNKLVNNIGDSTIISRVQYQDKLQGFWLGQCIANWTGLVTEMDKIGNIGEIKTGAFYTRDDWGKPDQPSIWGEGVPSNISSTIDFVLMGKDSIWGADDDTDIEYIYQHLLYQNKTSILSAEQIKEGWLKHIKKEEENYLWVSNQKAFDLMQKGVVPPETSNPSLNEHYEMIDAQLTTEIYGLFAPGHPDKAIEMAYLPIRTTAREDAAWISEFYVSMYALASDKKENRSQKSQIFWMADQSKKRLPETSYARKMYNFVLKQYQNGASWEAARDSLYQRYQVEQQDGYKITSKNLYCNGCFAAGINFGASLISLFYGEGDFKQTVKIGVLAGWDSDNPTATWGGMLGFMMGKTELEKLFDQPLSQKFNIHRTRINFEKDGIDTFHEMANKGVTIIDRVVQEELNGYIDFNNNAWVIPLN